jgi:hypothetical protein
MLDKGRSPFIAVWLLLLATHILLYGCSATVKEQRQLPELTGRLEILPGTVALETLSIPSEEVLQHGALLRYTPIEISGTHARFSTEGIEPSIGQSAAIRIVGEGLLGGLPENQAKIFTVRYWIPFAQLNDARKRFPHLMEEQILRHPEGKQGLEVLNWTFRLVLLPDRDNKAFRLMTDSLAYYLPLPETQEQEELAADKGTGKPGAVPVFIGFLYRYPQYAQQNWQQHNVIFDYAIAFNDKGKSVGKPQLSNWLPLQPDSANSPYSIEIAVAEITSEPEQFLKKLQEFILGVKNII